MTQNLKKILFLLSPKEKKSLIYLLFVTLIMGFLNMIGIVSILPFMAVLTNPSLIIENEILKKLFEFSAYLGVNSNNEFLYFLGMGVFLLLFFSLSFNAFTIFLQLRFIQMCQWSISRRLFEKYINQPYSWFLNRNSANLEKTLLSEVSNVIVGGLTPMITLITRSILVILITILLFFTDPILACFIFTFFAFLYGLIYKTIRRYLGRIGKEKLEANRLRFLTLSEAFGAIKEVKASGLENLYLNRFSYSSKIFAYNQSSSQILVQLPRFFLESIAFGGMLLVILYLISRSGNLNTVIPIMSLYALAGYRLLPALQEVFSSISQLRFISPSLNLIYKDLTLVNNLSSKNGYNKLSFNGKLRLSGVCYGYPESSSVSLKNINIEINAYSKIGIIGTTGSGKTTLVDIILGLLEPQNGQIYIDGKLINKENLRFWQNSIGYVPQKVYLADSSIEKNIAFGVDKEKIDKKKLKKVSKIAYIDKFIEGDLPDKYKTTIGERGIKLSGGQIQRIGLARALYRDPKILILDEATSALDAYTEEKVMQAINKFTKKITTIIISHRLSSLSNCEIIFVLEKGELVQKGKYEDLNEYFTKLSKKKL